jgi:hypothetical protein
MGFTRWFLFLLQMHGRGIMGAGIRHADGAHRAVSLVQIAHRQRTCSAVFLFLHFLVAATAWMAHLPGRRTARRSRGQGGQRWRGRHA